MRGYIPYYQLNNSDIVESIPNPYEELIHYADDHYDMFGHISVGLRGFMELDGVDRQAVVYRLYEKHMFGESNVSFEDDVIRIHAPASGDVRIRFMKIQKDGRRRKFRYAAVFDFNDISSFTDICPGNPAKLSYYEHEGISVLPNVFSMMVACSYLDSFYPEYKKSYMRAKSITSIIGGVVKPVCDATAVDFTHVAFTIISSISDTVICRRECSYENYIDNIRDYADKLKLYIDGHKD